MPCFFLFHATTSTEIYTLPYTTLFRSMFFATCWVIVEAPTGRRLLRQRPTSVSAARSIDSGDRKSTRLNSSHMSISYAVFCLKKKRNLLFPERLSQHPP